MTPGQLRQKRKQYKLTQQELANMLGVTVTTVARWEQGVHRIKDRRMVDIELAIHERERKRGAA